MASGGTEGNERLTALTGVLLLGLLVVLGVTILRLRPLLNEHMFLGILLIGPVALKLASTGYRFVRYYTSEPRYRRRGPPQIAMRLLAPLVVLSTLVVFASGVFLMFAGPSSRDLMLPIHKVSFIVWVVVAPLHVFGHLLELPRALGSSPRGAVLAGVEVAGAEDSLPGRGGRALALGGALVAGAVLAILSIPRFAPWIDAHSSHH